jgi:hypothetical protein
VACSVQVWTRPKRPTRKLDVTIEFMKICVFMSPLYCKFEFHAIAIVAGKWFMEVI